MRDRIYNQKKGKQEQLIHTEECDFLLPNIPHNLDVRSKKSLEEAKLSSGVDQDYVQSFFFFAMASV